MEIVGIGGIIAARYENNYEFDHGAQFFYTKVKIFKTCVPYMM
jgi:predicted NAD/FAD-dependent oxidoreductase